MRSLAAVFVTLVSLGFAGCSKPAPVVVPQGNAVDLRGTWKNERGSELKIDGVVDGASARTLTGQFRSAVGKVDPQQWFPVVGFEQGDVVGFSVDFTTAGSVASWAGQVMDNQLVTQWHLSRDIPDAEEHDKIWSSIMSGADTFTRE